ncbi:hypothetical protein EDD17DRAFT_1511140 [Pisolithus thermaeus]|nr:hypothetical protein EDD17DRAFT_1511140 [Pisolithus thermaeus]
MDRLAKEMVSASETYGLARPRYGVKWHESLTGQCRKGERTAQLMGRPDHDEGCRCNVWAGPSAIWSEMGQLMDGPVHKMRQNNSGTGPVAKWNQMEQLIEGPVCRFPFTSQIYINILAAQEGASVASHEGASVAGAEARHSSWACPSIVWYDSCSGLAATWSETEIFCHRLINLGSSSLPVNSQACISNLAAHGGASVADSWQTKHETCPVHDRNSVSECEGNYIINESRTHGELAMVFKIFPDVKNCQIVHPYDMVIFYTLFHVHFSGFHLIPVLRGGGEVRGQMGRAVNPETRWNIFTALLVIWPCGQFTKQNVHDFRSSISPKCVTGIASEVYVQTLTGPGRAVRSG